MSTKQVIVLRKDLNMRKGKMVAQGSHASLAVFTKLVQRPYESEMTIPLTEAMQEWLNDSFRKICVSVNSEKELRDIYEQAEKAGLPCSLMLDNGLTEFGGVPTYTAVAVGPAKDEDINPITGSLPLL